MCKEKVFQAVFLYLKFWLSGTLIMILYENSVAKGERLVVMIVKLMKLTLGGYRRDRLKEVTALSPLTG